MSLQNLSLPNRITDPKYFLSNRIDDPIEPSELPSRYRRLYLRLNQFYPWKKQI